MKILDVILIGIALSMDAVALTISNCSTYKESLTKKKEWSMPIAFALFQGIMPLLGYLIGSTFSKSISSYADFVSCGVFFLLGAKILVDLLKEKYKKNQTEIKHKAGFSYLLLLVQAIATSIDAFIIGITLATSTFSIFISITIISAVTFLLVTLALLLGKYLGNILGKSAEWVGMGILFALSIKNLVTALV